MQYTVIEHRFKKHQTRWLPVWRTSDHEIWKEFRDPEAPTQIINFKTREEALEYIKKKETSLE